MSGDRDDDPKDAAQVPISWEDIRQRAYELWERNHRPAGLEIEFWLLAERELKAERRVANAGRSSDAGR